MNMSLYPGLFAVLGFTLYKQLKSHCALYNNTCTTICCSMDTVQHAYIYLNIYSFNLNLGP